MATKIKVIVPSETGLHLRPAADLVTLLSKFDSEITIEYKGVQVNGKSIMGLLMLAAEPFAELTVIAEGPDEKDVCAATDKFFKEEIM
jgi:phosphocarrier protein HPr